MLSESFFIFVLVGFLAQLIDGSIGMAYGVISASALISLGFHPAIASASIHFAKLFVTTASGIAHLKLDNVQREIAFWLTTFGIFGGALGAYLSAQIIPTKTLILLVDIILLSLGLLILIKFVTKHSMHFKISKLSPIFLQKLGFLAALISALGGGGWGPVTVSTLAMSNIRLNKIVGSVILAEIFVSMSIFSGFVASLTLERLNWEITLGLLIGGVLCAPISAFLCKKLPQRILGILVGISIIILSARMLIIGIASL